MATKTNSSIAIDRESISLLNEYATLLTNDLESLRQSISKNVRYLSDDSVISGAEADKFKESIAIVETTSASALAKMQKFSNAIHQISQRYVSDAASAGRSLDSVKDDLQALKKKVDDVK